MKKIFFLTLIYRSRLCACVGSYLTCFVCFLFLLNISFTQMSFAKTSPVLIETTLNIDGIPIQSDENGKKVDIRLYSGSDEDKSTIWEETHAGIVFSSGTCSIQAGSVNEMKPEYLEQGDAFGISIYKGDVKGEEAEIPIYAVPKAKIAETAEKIIGMNIDEKGNVGIGVSVPTEILEVSGTIKASKFMGDGSGLIGIYDVYEKEYQEKLAKGEVKEKTNNSGGNVGNGIYHKNGNIGIGIKDPQEKFHVVGGLIYSETNGFKFPDESIQLYAFKKDSVGTEHIIDGTIQSADLADEIITTEKLAQESVINEKLGVDAVTSDKIQNQSIQTEDIIDSIITTKKLMNKTVTTEKLDDNAVTNEKIKSVGWQKITNKKEEDPIFTQHVSSQIVTVGSKNIITNDERNLLKTALHRETDPKIQIDLQNAIPKWDGENLITGVLFDTNGNIGIGTTEPLTSLEIAKNIYSGYNYSIQEPGYDYLMQEQGDIKYRGSLTLHNTYKPDNNQRLFNALDFSGLDYNGERKTTGRIVQFYKSDSVGQKSASGFSFITTGKYEKDFMEDKLFPAIDMKEVMTIKGNRVGIGTINPRAALDVRGEDGLYIANNYTNDHEREELGWTIKEDNGGNFVIGKQGDTFTKSPIYRDILQISSKGNLKVQTLEIEDTIKAKTFIGDGSGLTGVKSGKWEDSENQNNIYYNSGNVGIGVTDPRAILDVAGRIIANEIEVDVTKHADYVFLPDYNLIPLNEVETKIKELGRLPGMPSAKEVETKRLNIGEMQEKLLEKIEELTLYLIDQYKNNKQQDIKIKKLERENKKIKIFFNK